MVAILKVMFLLSFSYGNCRSLFLDSSGVYPGFSWMYACIGADGSLVPFKQHAFVWTNDGLAYWRMYARHKVLMR